MNSIFQKYDIEQVIADADECMILEECLEARGDMSDATFAAEFVKVAKNYNDFYYDDVELVLEYMAMKYNPSSFVITRN